MSHYKKLTILGNLKRIKLLIEFRNLLITYFSNLEYSEMGLEVQEKIKARKVRSEINKVLDKMYSIIILAGVNPTMYYSPPPAVGGIAVNIDLIHNIFNLHLYQINSQTLLDFIERAIGIYEEDKLYALLRTINPLFLPGIILDYIVSLPFKFIGKIGFNQDKIESSVVGKIIKGILYLITVFAAFLTVLEKLGYLNNFISLIKD